MEILVAVLLIVFCLVECLDEVYDLCVFGIEKLARGKVDGYAVIPAVGLVLCLAALCMDYAILAKAAMIPYGLNCIYHLRQVYRQKSG